MPESEVERQNNCFLVARPTHAFWSVFRFQDCVDVLQDVDTYSNKEGPGPERMAQLSPDGMLLVADNPAHQRQRRIANKAFLPRTVERHRDLIQSTADDLVDKVAPAGRADVMSEIAIPLAVAMITGFFGVGGDRQGQVATWGSATMNVLGGDPEAVQAGATALSEMFAFIVEKISERRAGLEQGSEIPDDLLSAMIVAEHEGNRLTDEEICLAAGQFLSAGFETTATAIGNAVYLMCTHPSERAKLERDWSLLDAAAEECLRYESPLEGTFRTTTKDTLIGGQEVPAGSKVRVVYASANRDEQCFPRANEFRVDRPILDLRRHIAFGHGTHSCIGSALARAELKIALKTVLRRLPGLDLAPDRPPERARGYMVNGFTSLPITWDPATTVSREER